MFQPRQHGPGYDNLFLIQDIVVNFTCFTYGTTLLAAADEHWDFVDGLISKQ